MKVFISYAREDIKEASEIVGILEHLGIESFIDTTDIRIGEPALSKILRTLNNEITHLIAILSPASIKSQWVAYEIGYATAKEIVILPFLTQTTISLPTFIQGLNYTSDKDLLRDYFKSEITPKLITPYEIPLNKNEIFSYPSYPETITIKEQSKNRIALHIDFSQNRPSFVGCAVKLFNEDWSKHLRNDCFLSFKINFSNNINKIKLEIKGKNREIINHTYIEKNDIIDTDTLCYSLSDFDDNPLHWFEMTQLTFVIQPEDVSNVGEIQIEDIFITNETINDLLNKSNHHLN